MTGRRLEDFLELWRSYGRTLDLSSPGVLRDPKALLDLVAAYAEAIPEGVEVLDLGSGGGWPALPLAALRPDLELLLVERRSRRVAFLELAAAKLGLENVRVFAGDVRDLEGEFAHVTAQAVAPLPELFRLVRHLSPGAQNLYTARGPDWRRELAELRRRARAEVFHVKPLAQGGTLVGVRVEPR